MYTDYCLSFADKVVDGNQLKFGGDERAGVISYFSIMVTKCQKVGSSSVCASDDEIEQYLD